VDGIGKCVGGDAGGPGTGADDECVVKDDNGDKKRGKGGFSVEQLNKEHNVIPLQKYLKLIKILKCELSSVR
jgi:hypothetical protein